MIYDHEIAQFPESKLEAIIGQVLKAAKFEIDEMTKSRCLEIARTYNKKSGALAVNALSIMGYSAEKDKKTFFEMLEILGKYDFPTPKAGEVPAEHKYMHPQLRADIMRRGQGTLKEDRDFFKDLYDKLDIKPQK